MHWVAHTRGNFRNVCGAKSARWLWAHLKAAFPKAYALCLMPDHVHLVVPGGADFASFKRVLERLTQLDDGTVPPPPSAGDPDGTTVASLRMIAGAVASALRREPADITARGRSRRLFVQLALATARPRHAELAAACRVAPQAIRQAARVSDEAGLRCAARCLHDARLRIHDVPDTTACEQALRRSA